MDSSFFISTIYGNMSRSTRNSQDAIYFAPCLTASSLGSTGSSLPATPSQSDVFGTNSSTSAVSATPAQPSTEFLATVVQAVKRALPADQAPVLQANRPWSEVISEHLSDVAFYPYGVSAPFCTRIKIKVSKTGPFC